jgi:hypothetical protein
VHEHLTSQRAREEGAALIMAIIVMLVLSTLSLAVLGRTLSVTKFIRQGQDYDAALARADAGLADALFKIDQNAPTSWQGVSCVNPAAPCTLVSNASNRKFKYWAKKNSDSEYVISVTGYSGTSRHALQARVNRNAQFPYALFSRAPLHLDGAASAGNVKITFGLFAGSGDVRVGSNSTVVCNGTVPPNVMVDWYQSQSECPVPQVTKLAAKRDLAILEPSPPIGVTDPNWENCPNSGVFGSTTTTTSVTDPVTGVVTSATIPTSISNPITISGNSGPYVCRRNVTLLGTVVPNPSQDPVKIYILPRTEVGVTTYYSLDMSAAVVNPVQSATKFQIYKVGSEPIYHNTINDYLTFRGVLFAPDTQMVITGGNLNWAGSINIGQLTVNGTPNMKILYDYDLSTYLGPDWRVSRYREISAPEAVPVWGTP